MKQILQNIQNGAPDIMDVPVPGINPGMILISTSRTAISPGTERMLHEFGRANWLQRARQQPDKVKMVLDKVRTDGLLPTLEAVQYKLNEPIALGYCNAGVALEVGEGVVGFRPGDRIASNGAHAEIVRVSQNLCAKIPEAVSDDEAAFTVLGAIALQGIRLTQPTLGEAVVVTGLGLVGLLTVQLLRANGCRVLGIDYSSERLEIARQFGAQVVDLSRGEDPLAHAHQFSRGRGVDAVLITAATNSNEPVHQAAKMSRKRGRIVLVGVAGMELSRADFFEKELSFQVSCSYGPGRYDADYEERGQDYPLGFVRWTEQRNFEAVLDMLADRRLDVKPLISHRFKFDQAAAAYELLGSDQPSLGILLEYSKTDTPASRRIELREPQLRTQQGTTDGPSVVGFLGAGNHAGRVLMPAFKKAGAQLHTVVSSGGVSAARLGRKFGFEIASTEPADVLDNLNINSVVIATRHDTHASYVCQALEAGKHVFVEKPLAMTLEELEHVRAAWEASGSSGERPVLMVGFNRRYSPHAIRMQELLAAQPEPKAYIMTVNAGSVPPEHWTLDLKKGGGRIVGEACHFVDLLRFLADSPIVDYSVQFLDRDSGSASITLSFENDSMGTIHYLANGHRSFPKERLEVFCGKAILSLDNFRKLKGFGWQGFSKMNLHKQNKGQGQCVAMFEQLKKDSQLSRLTFEQTLEVSRVAIELANQGSSLCLEGQND